MQRREQPVDLVDGKGLGVKIITDPVEHLLVPFVVGVTDGLYEIVESGNASTIFRWTRKLTIGADRIRRIRIRWKPLLQDDSVLPAIAHIIRVDGLGAEAVKSMSCWCGAWIVGVDCTARYLGAATRDGEKVRLLAQLSRLQKRGASASSARGSPPAQQTVHLHGTGDCATNG